MQEPIDGLTITVDCGTCKSAVDELVSIVLEDVKALREQETNVKDRLPVEVMALNAVNGAFKITMNGKG